MLSPEAAGAAGAGESAMGEEGEKSERGVWQWLGRERAN